MSPGSEARAVVDGRAATVDLVEGEQRVVDPAAAEGRDPTEPGPVYPRQLVLRVVKVFEGAALLEYGPVGDQPAAYPQGA